MQHSLNKTQIIFGLERVHRLRVEADAYIGGAARVLQGHTDNAMLETAIVALENARKYRNQAAAMERDLDQGERNRMKKTRNRRNQ